MSKSTHLLHLTLAKYSEIGTGQSSGSEPEKEEEEDFTSFQDIMATRLQTTKCIITIQNKRARLSMTCDISYVNPYLMKAENSYKSYLQFLYICER